MQASDVAGWVTLGLVAVCVFLLLRRRARNVAARAEARATATSGGATVNLGGIHLTLDGALAEALARGYERSREAEGWRVDGCELCERCSAVNVLAATSCATCGLRDWRAPAGLPAAPVAPVAVRLRDGATWEA